MKTSLKRFFAGVAAVAMAVGGLALGATSAQAAVYDTNRIADPDLNGTITINPVSGDTQKRTFSGYRLARLKNVKVKTDSTGTALDSFTVETNSSADIPILLASRLLM